MLPLASPLLCAAGASKSAEAAPTPCGDRNQILELLKQTDQDEPQALGLSGDGDVIEVLVSPADGRTVLITYPKRPTCVIAVGESWQILRAAGQPA